MSLSSSSRDSSAGYCCCDVDVWCVASLSDGVGGDVTVWCVVTGHSVGASVGSVVV
jgi:hypothetical protein